MAYLIRRCVTLAAFATFLSLITTPISAQTSRGTLTGAVRDQQAAAVPGVNVELTNQATNVARSTTTNEIGFFRFDAVDLGDYTVTVKQTGFQTFVKRSIPVLANQTVTLDVVLEVGETSTTIEVVAQTEVALQYESPVRGSNYQAASIRELPLPVRNPVSLAFTAPGVSTTRYSFGTGGGQTGRLAVNGSRGRSNNFLLDGTENNDISIAGQAFEVKNPDAVQEMSIQTSNFDAEFGRAGGAVVNVITKSGTNQFHGSANFLLDVTNDDAITSTQSLSPEIVARGKPPQGTEQFYGGTIGGPIVKDRSFFFFAYQKDRQFSTSTNIVRTLSGRGKATLNEVFPSGRNPRADLYRNMLGNLEATGQFFLEQLGDGRPALEFGSAISPFGQTLDDDQYIARVDHRFSDNDLVSGRYMISSIKSPHQIGTPFFPGFATSQFQRFQNAAITYTRIFSPSWTNELRVPYNRITLDFPNDAENPLAATMSRYVVAGNPTDFGVSPSFPQGRIANNYLLQDTVSHVHGAHTLRFGMDVLAQRSRQFAPAAFRGVLTYNASTGYSGFANFLDDFGGATGTVQRDFGSALYYPELTRHQYFVQDRWRATQSLTVTLGLRYENHGTPMNSVGKASFSGLFNVDPVTFTGPYSELTKVKADNNNWAPSLGLAYSPAVSGGLLGRILGDRKSVIRTGYQIGYDTFFNNIASNAQASSPNLLATQVVSSATAQNLRGLANFSSFLPTTARSPQPADTQTLAISGLRNPYYQKWSFGVQRELPGQFVLDLSYVGTSGTRLFINEDSNPVAPSSLRITPVANPPVPASRMTSRLDNIQGGRTTRTNGGHSSYHAMQVAANRRLFQGFQVRLAYTWSKLLDNASEIFSPAGINSSSLAAVPAVFGGQARERAVSTFDRTQRLVMAYVYDLPWMKNQRNIAGRVLGGWSVSGITTFESGVPFNVVNGLNADGIGGSGDRPNYNPNGQRNVRAVFSSTSPTGYINPDAGGAPIDPAQAEFIGLPAQSGANPGVTGNLGRNVRRTPGINNFDVTLTKSVKIAENWRFQFRTEFFNFFNHPQYGSPSISPFSPGEGVFAASVATSGAGQFLNLSLPDGGGRVIRYQVKLLF
ncbi:MAG: carboxypeptidase regulatory-like domain-containing protein [Bryobacteraceae bacterium]